jgi:O-antigen ligase
MWVALAAAAVYVGVRHARARNVRSMLGGAAVLAIAAAMIFATPLGTVFNDRVTKHSNSTQTRLGVYRDTTQQVRQSPLFGYGSPRASADPNSPPLGTQGQLFLVLFAHGIPGLAFFVAWFGSGVLRSFRRRSRDHLWAHLAIIVFLIEMPFYSFMPTTLHIIMLPAALIWRDAVTRPRRAVAA